MEMALRPQSPLCPPRRPMLTIRSTNLPQYFLMINKFTGRRIIRYMVEISDYHNRKTRRPKSPKIEINAFRGYAPRLTIESSTKIEHKKSDEETLGSYNRLLSNNAAEWTDSTEVETTNVHLSQNASSSSIIGEVDVVNENIIEANLLGNASGDVKAEEVDVIGEIGVEEEKFEMGMQGNVSSGLTVGELDEVNDARLEEDLFEVDLSGTALNSATEVDVLEKVVVEDLLVVDLSGTVLSNDSIGEAITVDEVVDEEDTFQSNLSGLASTRTPKDEDEVGQDTFGDDLSEIVSRSVIYGEVDVVNKTKIEKVISGMGLSANGSSSATPREVGEVNESMVEEEIFEMDLFGAVANEKTYQQNETTSLTYMADWAIDETLACLNPVSKPLVRVHEEDKSVFGIHEQQCSNINFHEQEQTTIAFDKQNQPLFRFPKHNQSSTKFLEQNKSIVDSHEQDESTLDVPKQIQSIVGSSKQNQSIIALHKQDQSIIAFREQEESIVDVPKQIQSIVASSKQHQSIVTFQKQDQSIVSAPQQQHSIVGFNKQDVSIVGFSEQNLSIVGTSREDQTKQVAIVGRHDEMQMKEMNYTNEDYTFQKTVEDVSKNLLQEHEADNTEEAMKIPSIIEDQKRVDTTKVHMMVSEDGITMDKIETSIGGKLHHVFFEEELLRGEKEDLKDDEHYKVDETSMSTEPDTLKSPQEDMDPQALRTMIQELANKNYSMGNKLFVFPEIVKADTTIDLYLNRDLSTLANEPDVLIKGAFNSWRWRLFTERLHKSELPGDWWHCKLYIPRQAYRLDFVFFNGRTIYENNENNDFMIHIDSAMDEDLFEKFFVEEKQKELERLATEEAERRIKTEEQQRMEEERAASEAARSQAKVEVEMKKNKLQNMLGLARTCADNLWYIEPSTYRRGDRVKLYYNRHSRPLMHSTDIWMHGGYNIWTDGLSITERLVKSDEKDGDWWYADVILPEKAFVLDWVFADGSPGNARNYDNNGRQDFHAILANIMAEEDYWAEEEQIIYTRLLHERREREEAVKQKSERRAKMKAMMKERTMKMFLLSQKHIVYTEPLEIHAGTSVNVLYNPSNTVLNGKPEVWFRCSFNRWTHPSGVLQPQKMVKANDGLLLKATVNVPVDAYMMDFVFSESEDGGIFDNRNGVDYHIPVSGSIAKETSMHIVHIAVEMAPIAKVGGLGDVVTSLSRAIQDLGHTVQVILPKYDCLNLNNVRSLHLHQSFPWGGTEIKVWLGIVEDLSVYFLEPQNGMFGVGCVYGRNDDRRFGFFCHSALEFLLQNGSSPHIIHCHDWSSAPVAWLYKEHYANSRLASARVIFTIHNLEFGAHYIGKAMKYCDKATTVSNTYSREVAGHGAIAPHRGKFYGIVNGIDPDIWDPYTDNFIPVHYTSENVVEGKNAAKRALQQKLGLQQADVPIVGIVTRLTAQKGIHLIKHAIHRTLERNGQVVLLGSAPDGRIQSDFCHLADTLHGVYHGQVKLCLTYDEPLSHLIYAGSDFVLVPSIFEPCGLTQLVAMRYGTIPIVRRTGGLYDTVFDVDHDKDRARSHGLEPNGFSFDGADGNGVDYGLNRAISAWFDARDWFHSLCKTVMEQDWSWNRPALDYIELYHSAHKF